MQIEKPSIRLLKVTEDAEELVCAAAKLCYASDSEKIFEGNSKDIEVFLGRLRKMGHLSPFEHASYTFLVEGVSRAMTHQLVRHRLASYSQRSQRYVTHENFDYIVPPSLRGKTVYTEKGPIDAEYFFIEFMERTALAYGRLLDALGGDNEQSKEDARYILPNSAETKIIVTMNARELFHFFGERLCERAQWEIRETANQMLELVRHVSPVIFKGIGPKCVSLGHCPEGKMSCGKFSEKVAKYSG